MKLSRIDHIALNGGDGQHYKYEEVATDIVDRMSDMLDCDFAYKKEEIIKLLVEAFPDDETC